MALFSKLNSRFSFFSSDNEKFVFVSQMGKYTIKIELLLRRNLLHLVDVHLKLLVVFLANFGGH